MFGGTPQIIRIPQNFGVKNAANAVSTAMQAYGEEVIALSMYNVAYDILTQPRCSNCYDPLYRNSKFDDCAVCYGTTFEGGVKKVERCWSIFDDAANGETINKHGESYRWENKIQLEANPTLRQHDYLIRVKRWEYTKTPGGLKIPEPLEFGERYQLGVVEEVTLRAGARYGKDVYDKVAQTTNGKEVLPDHVIYSYPVPDPILRYDEVVV